MVFIMKSSNHHMAVAVSHAVCVHQASSCMNRKKMGKKKELINTKDPEIVQNNIFILVFKENENSLQQLEVLSEKLTVPKCVSSPSKQIYGFRVKRRPYFEYKSFKIQLELQVIHTLAVVFIEYAFSFRLSVRSKKNHLQFYGAYIKVNIDP